MPNKRSLGGLVGTALGASMTAAQGVHPEWFGHHAWIFPVSLLVLGFSLLLWLAQVQWFQKNVLGLAIPESAHDDASTVSLSAGTTISTESVAGRDNDNSRNYTAETIHVIEAPLARNKERRERPRATLRPLEIEFTEDKDEFMGRFKRGEYLWLMPVENPMPSVSADGVCATIRFNTVDGRSVVVPRAFWYKIDENEVFIDLNHFENVVLGKYVPGRWIYFWNKQQFRNTDMFQGADSYRNEKSKEVLSIPLSTPIEVEVEILNRSQEYSYFKTKYRITENEVGCEIKLWP